MLKGEVVLDRIGGFPKLGLPKLGVPTVMENQMQKKMENEMETEVI